jgi:hypothetical protein
MIKFALLMACLPQGPGLPPGNVYDRVPEMTASLSPGTVTQKQGTSKCTTITTNDLDQYLIVNATTGLGVVITVGKKPTVNASLQSSASGNGAFGTPNGPTTAGDTTRTHTNVLKSTGTLSQIIVVDTFSVVDLDTDIEARDGSVQLGQIVEITKV